MCRVRPTCCNKPLTLLPTPPPSSFPPPTCPSAPSPADGSPFKSVDEREREREVGRLRAEVADLQHQLTSAKGEGKALRKQVAKAQGDARQASEAASEAKAAAAAATEQATEAAKAAAKRVGVWGRGGGGRV